MYFTVLVSFGLLSPFLPAEANKCSEKEMLLRQVPRVVTQLTDCLMECSGMTFIKKLQLQDNRNIQFKDSTEGKEPRIRLSIAIIFCQFITTSLILSCFKLNFIYQIVLCWPASNIYFPRRPWGILLVYRAQVHHWRELSACLRGAARGYICSWT